MAFVKATKKQSKLRMALIGPSGSGKTYSALAIGSGLGQRIAVVDTERGSASKYSDRFEFDVMELESYHPQAYIDAIFEAEMAGYEVLILDSLSHAWMGKDGALELVDRAKQRQKTENSFTAWRDVTPLHNALVDAILRSKLHVIGTMRSKTEYVMEEVERNGRKFTQPRKVGLAPIQRDGLEYEFDVIGDMDLDNRLVVGKTRCPAIAGGVYHEPGEQFASILRAWLEDGEPVPTLEMIMKKIDEAEALPHLANIWKKYLPAIKRFSPADVDILTRAKEQAKARLSLPQPATPKPEEVTSNEPV